MLFTLPHKNNNLISLNMSTTCACGYGHTITLTDDGVVYSFGDNNGQLGLESGVYEDIVSLPTPISNLPKIKQVSCGLQFTFCVDHEGFVWTFGDYISGQFGIVKPQQSQVLPPQKINDIPPVLSVACGKNHILIITSDLDLWSCGDNDKGQLCLEHRNSNFEKFLQTSFSNISNISVGKHYSLFQNEKGEIFSCGNNTNGELALGHFDSPQIKPTKIPNLPSNIVTFVCGNSHNLFLDSEGNVYSVGRNSTGELGLGHITDQNVLNQIPNIPLIQTISCAGNSSYLLDFEGNVWSFGDGRLGELGHGDTLYRDIPTKIENLKDIQQISYGSCGCHFLAKDSQNTIFATGENYFGELGIGNKKLTLIPTELNSQYSTIWGSDPIAINNRVKSARK